jgi:hypothetical protein
MSMDGRQSMVTGELKSRIDAVWNDFWSGGISNLLEVMEQLTYLLFFKGLDDADRRIIDRLRPALRDDGLHFVGIDVIDGHLSEVNVTSPTGIRQLGALTGTRPDLEVMNWLEQTTSTTT